MTFRKRALPVKMVTIRLGKLRLILLKRKPRSNLPLKKGDLKAVTKDRILVISMTLLAN